MTEAFLALSIALCHDFKWLNSHVENRRKKIYKELYLLKAPAQYIQSQESHNSKLFDHRYHLNVFNRNKSLGARWIMTFAVMKYLPFFPFSLKLIAIGFVCSFSVAKMLNNLTFVDWMSHKTYLCKNSIQTDRRAKNFFASSGIFPCASFVCECNRVDCMEMSAKRALTKHV